MSKTTENVLLVPGETGWEIWTASAGTEFTLHSATAAANAGDLTDLPSGDLILLFPVKAATTVPMRVTGVSLSCDAVATASRWVGGAVKSNS